MGNLEILTPAIDPRSDATLWTPALVEERLIEAFEFQARIVRVGHRRIEAKDGPWRLVIRDVNAGAQDLDNMADYASTTDVDREARGRGGLRSHEVDRMEEALGWYAHVPEGDLRRLVGVVITMMASPGAAGGAHVHWAEVRRRLRSDRSPDALRMRYTRSLSRIARALSARK